MSGRESESECGITRARSVCVGGGGYHVDISVIFAKVFVSAAIFQFGLSLLASPTLDLKITLTPRE